MFFNTLKIDIVISGYNLLYTGKIAPGLAMPGDEGGGSFPRGKVNHEHGKIERSADAP